MATVEVTVDADGAFSDWSQPTTGEHWDDIDDPDAPGADHIAAFYSYADDDDVDEFSIEPVDMGGDVCSQVVIWTYGWHTGTSLSEVQLDIGGETHGPVDVPLTGSSGWVSNTFTPVGADWTEAQCTAAKLSYHADCAIDKESTTIYAVKLIFTYPTPAGYGNSFLGVPAAKIGKVLGVPTANIGKVLGI